MGCIGLRSSRSGKNSQSCSSEHRIGHIEPRAWLAIRLKMLFRSLSCLSDAIELSVTLKGSSRSSALIVGSRTSGVAFSRENTSQGFCSAMWVVVELWRHRWSCCASRRPVWLVPERVDSSDNFLLLETLYWPFARLGPWQDTKVETDAHEVAPDMLTLVCDTACVCVALKDSP